MASIAASSESGGSRAPRTSVQMDEDSDCDSGSPLVAVRQWYPIPLAYLRHPVFGVRGYRCYESARLER